MTREEAINILSQMIKDGEGFLSDNLIEADKMALQALSQETCDDAISRDAVIRLIRNENSALNDIFVTHSAGEKLSKQINELPSVTQKSGMWIPVSERLPEDSGEYLIAIKDRHYNEQWFDLSWFYPRERVWSLRNVDVIAWMPLPKPYEPQESEDK